MLPTLTAACLLLAAPAALVLDGTVTAAVKPAGLVLTTADGTAHPLDGGDALKLLTRSADLHGRPVRLTALAPAGRLRVTTVQTLKAGKPFDVDYWCETCQMSYDEPGVCKCCGGETVLRERPAK